MMYFEYRRDYLEEESHRLHLAEIDMTIPALYDPLFKVSEKSIQERARLFHDCYIGKNYFEVALDTRQLVAGFHAIRIDDYFGTKVGVIDTLWVAPTYRQLGLGSELKRHGEAWAREQELHNLSTWVHANNKPMVELNKSMGYEIVHYKFMKKL